MSALNVTCTSLNISFTTPYYRDLCGDSDDCGYFPVQIRNPDVRIEPVELKERQAGESCDVLQ
eukprot:1117257-Amorphochlora_amoeboformis.AAC.1